MADRLRVYRGDARWLVCKMPAESDRHFAGKPKLTPPLLPHALRQISFLYDIPPHRMSEDAATWERIFWAYGSSGFNGVEHFALPMAKLLGQVHCWYEVTKSPFEPRDVMRAAQGRILLGDVLAGISARTWTSDKVVALPSNVDGTVAQALLLFDAIVVDLAVADPTGVHPAAHGSIVERWFYVDDTFVGVILHTRDSDDWTVMPAPDGNGHLVPHGLGLLPVQSQPWTIDPNQDGYWVEPWGGVDLLPNLGEVYTQLSEYMWTARLQRGQPVGRGITSAPLGPDHIVELGKEPTSTFTILDNSANLTGMKESVTTALEILAKSLGLPSRTFRLDDTAAMSGIAIALDSGELEDQRRGDEQTWRFNEAMAHYMAGKVWAVRAGDTLAQDVTVAFSPLSPILTQDQRQALVALERGPALRTMSRKEAKTILHPDLTERTVDTLLAAADSELGGPVPPADTSPPGGDDTQDVAGPVPATA